MSLQLERGVVGYWCPMLATTGLRLYDRSGRGNHGTLTNMVPASDWVTAKVRNTAGRVLDFDGLDDYVNFGNVLDFERTHPFTISAWVRAISLPSFSVIATKSEDAPNLRGYFFSYDSDRRLGFILRNTVGNRILIQTTSAALTLNTWGHVVVAYDGSSQASGVKFFSNGVSALSTIGEDTLTATTINSAPLVFGARPFRATPDGFSNAQIAEACIWDRALTAGEIRTLYRIGPGWFGKRESRFPGVAEQAAAFNRRRRVLLTAG